MREGSGTGGGRLAYAYARAGKRDSASAVLNDLERRFRSEYIPAYSIAVAYAGLGDIDSAMAWLEKAIEMHDPNIALYFRSDFMLDNLRPDPRFQRLLRRVGLG